LHGERRADAWKSWGSRAIAAAKLSRVLSLAAQIVASEGTEPTEHPWIVVSGCQRAESPAKVGIEAVAGDSPIDSIRSGGPISTKKWVSD
jgi:hypothetical protein